MINHKSYHSQNRRVEESASCRQLLTGRTTNRGIPDSSYGKQVTILMLMILISLSITTLTRAQIPRLISYQGIYTDTLGVAKLDSTYSFTFRLYNTSSGGTALWTETKSIATKKGLFSTNFGDVTPLSLPFDVPYWLGIQVGANPELLPRTQLTSSSYSLRAIKADTAAYTAGATLTLPFAGSVSTTSPALSITNSGGGRTAYFKNDHPTTIFTPTVHVETRGLSNGLFSYIDTVANVGSAVLGQTMGNGQAIMGNANNPSSSGIGVRGNTTGSGDAIYGTASGSGTAIHGVSTGSGSAGNFQINNTSSSANVLSVGTTGTGNGVSVIVGNSSSNASGVVSAVTTSGYAFRGMSIGTGGGVYGEVTSGSLPAIYGIANGNGQAVQGTNTGTGSAGRFVLSNTSSSADAVFITTNGTGNALDCRITNSSSSSPTVSGTTNGLGRAASFTVSNSSNGSSAIYASTLGTGPAAYFETTNSSSTSPALQVSTIGGTGIAGSFNGRVKVNVLEILGGSDLAEPFESSEVEEIEPGTVMVIDPDSPGKLKPSYSAYDPKVAGIVSGAGGVKPGLTLKQEGMLDGKTTVAIAGRVYCKVEATMAPIEPGDLLTTSPMAGHAMKATDRDKANGAIIGKAMTGLASGTGLILVLVNLQ